MKVIAAMKATRDFVLIVAGVTAVILGIVKYPKEFFFMTLGALVLFCLFVCWYGMYRSYVRNAAPHTSEEK